MIFTRAQVFDACQRLAPGWKLSPLLVYAVCLQEGQKDEKTGQFDPSVPRLEQNYFRRYIMQMNLASTTEGLLALSWGVMQTMGDSLLQMGFFEWYFNQAPEEVRRMIKEPMSPFAVVSAINEYCVRLDWQVEYGARWLDTKRKLAKGDEGRMLDLWNGDMTGKYRAEVLEKFERVKGGFR